MLKGWVEPDLLVLDDLFLAQRISPEAAEVLQAIVHQRYKLHRAIVITSNRVVQDWRKYLADTPMATTILDRLIHRCPCSSLGAGAIASRRPLPAWVSAQSRHSPAVLPGGIWGGYGWGNLKWPSGAVFKAKAAIEPWPMSRRLRRPHKSVKG